MSDARPSAGDPLPPRCVQIEVHVGELRQLFNAIDPSPFRERDLPAHLGALDGRALAGRPGPDDDEIETIHRRYCLAGEGALSRGRR